MKILTKVFTATKLYPSFLLTGIPVDVVVNIFINSFGSIQETTMVRLKFI